MNGKAAISGGVGLEMIEKRLRDKIAQLIERSNACADAAQKTDKGLAEAMAWLAEAHHIVNLVLPDLLQPYRRQIESASILMGTTGLKVLT